MKQSRLIFQGDPCTMPIDRPGVQTVEDARAYGPTACLYLSDQSRCSPPRFGCIRVSSAKVARYILLFYGEASEHTLEMELEEFRRRAPLPPDGVEAYIDTPEHHYRQITDPELVVRRTGEFAKAILDLQPGERVFRNPQAPIPTFTEPGEGMPAIEAAESWRTILAG